MPKRLTIPTLALADTLAAAFAAALVAVVIVVVRFGAASPVAVTVRGEDSRSCVVLLHGLARTAASMGKLAERLAAAGHRVVSVDYPSRHFPIEELAEMALPAALEGCAAQLGAGDASAEVHAGEAGELPAGERAGRADRARGGIDAVHVVTHSLGGILLRQYLANAEVARLGRVVMLAPPNRGSEVVDAYRSLPPYRWLNGPAGDQLGTGEDGLPSRLGPLDADVAIVAGTASINPILSLSLPNPDDGKVSVASTRLDGMCAMLVVDVSHPFVMKDEAVIEEVVAYLDTGRFLSDAARYPPCPHADTPPSTR